MLKPEHIIDIFLQPGEFYFGDENTRIRTLLGSCVSITMWHPTRRVGGMCHYLLPKRKKDSGVALDGRYADEAMQLFLNEIKALKTHPTEYRVKVFGGGSMFSRAKDGSESESTLRVIRSKGCKDVPCMNVRAARTLVSAHGMIIAAEDLGGEGHRQIMFDIWSGDAWVRKPSDTREI